MSKTQAALDTLRQHSPNWVKMIEKYINSLEKQLATMREALKYCPECKEILVHANIGDGSVDIYCEDCGWPTLEIE